MVKWKNKDKLLYQTLIQNEKHKTITGSFHDNFWSLFHKTEVLKVHLVYLTYLNVNWIKTYDIKHKEIGDPIL